MHYDQSKYLPILLDISDKKILMLGAGNACREKLWSLGQVGVNITVIAPEIHEEFYNKPWINIINRKYQKGDLQGFSIVYVGINQPDLESEILREAQTQDVLINFIDKREFSAFISPSVIQRKNFSIFISTFGKAPAAAKFIRKQIEEKMDLDMLEQKTGEFIENRKPSK